jgi:hypothetical protein
MEVAQLREAYVGDETPPRMKIRSYDLYYSYNRRVLVSACHVLNPPSRLCCAPLVPRQIDRQTDQRPILGLSKPRLQCGTKKIRVQ